MQSDSIITVIFARAHTRKHTCVRVLACVRVRIHIDVRACTAASACACAYTYTNAGACAGAYTAVTTAWHARFAPCMRVAGDQWKALSGEICEKVVNGAASFFCGLWYPSASTGKYKYVRYRSYTVEGTQVWRYTHCAGSHELVIKEITNFSLSLSVHTMLEQADDDQRWSGMVRVHDASGAEVAKFWFPDNETVRVMDMRDRDMHACMHPRQR